MLPRYSRAILYHELAPFIKPERITEGIAVSCKFLLNFVELAESAKDITLDGGNEKYSKNSKSFQKKDLKKFKRNKEWNFCAATSTSLLLSFSFEINIILISRSVVN